MTNKYPRLRSHTRRRKSGKVVTYYVYDRRPEGLPDVPLGSDYDEALKRWDEIHNRAPRIAGTLQQAFDAWRLDEQDGLPAYTNAETRRGYGRQLKRLEPIFGESTWADVELSDLRGYLKARKAKTQANREMSLLSIIWNWARLNGYTKLPFPAAGLERSEWKNPEKPRKVRVTDELFDAVYPHGDQVLRDCMDLATATGMRLTDCRTILLPKGDVLSLEASKTGKEGDFDLSLSQVLPGLISRRRALKANHLMLLSTPTGRPVSERMLTDRWDAARDKAAAELEQRAASAEGEERDRLAALAAQVRRMYLRDMRKRAADLAGTEEEAAELLQHDDKRLTRKHYRTAVPKLKPVR
ncbi:MAG TPA: integrase [Methylibium sp.]|nr:integrase [Methylibium sp.]